MPQTVFATLLNNVSGAFGLSLGAPYTGGASLTLRAGDGAALLVRLAAEGRPGVGSPANLSVTVDDGLNRPTVLTATGLAGDVLTVNTAPADGTVVPSGGYRVGSRVEVRLTAGAVRALQAAVNALEATPALVTSVAGRTGDVTLAEADVAGLTAALASLAADATVVHLAGAESVTGVKTFTQTIAGSVSGNAGTVTNGVYTTGSYADPAWLTSLAGSKVAGNIAGNAASITGSVTESQVLGLTGDLAAKAVDAAVVHLTGNETVAGTKTFSSPIAGTITGNVTEAQVTNLSVDLAARAMGLVPSTPNRTATFTFGANEFATFDCTSSTFTGTLLTAPPDGTTAGGLLFSVAGTNGCVLHTGPGDTFLSSGGVTRVLTVAGQWILLQYSTARAAWVDFSGQALSVLDARYAALAGATFTGLVTVPSVNAAVRYGAIAADADGATVTFDLSVSNFHKVTLAGNRTLAVTNGHDGQPFNVLLTQDATGSRSVTWFAGILWPSGSVPTLTTTAGKTDVFGFLQVGAGSYLGFTLGKNL